MSELSYKIRKLGNISQAKFACGKKKIACVEDFLNYICFSCD